ncbi:MAG: TonB-dependent receptor [Alistipes sp.]|nr:TonB-dependent receptor [Alistipes sp.]
MRRMACITALLLASQLQARAVAENADADTVIVVDKVQVTAIKQGPVLRTQPVAATTLGSRAVAQEHVNAVKNLSQRVPNLHIPDYGSRMTSSIYVRGLGARIDQPVMGMNVDNVPVMNKDNYDGELADVERIEVLRGPQSTLYGRNTMGGVMNIYTLSPLNYQGTRIQAEYGSGNTLRLRAGVYARPAPGLGTAVSCFYTRSDGFFKNLATGRMCDGEQSGGGRLKLQWRSKSGLRIDNTLAFSALDQGGYPYAYAGKEIVRDGETVIRPGEIRYNDPAGYRRTTLSDGVTMRYDANGYSVASIFSYQYSDDAMTLDQDFLPLSYFTLRQARTEHTATGELVFRSHERGRYRWIAGAFGFYRHATMQAPVHFKRTGIEELILANANSGPIFRYDTDAQELLLASDFRNPAWGAALYHESSVKLGRWTLTAGIRADYERTRLAYRSRASLDYSLSIGGGPAGEHTATIDDRDALARSYLELLPKAAVMYSFDEVHNLYFSVAKGYKAGGFNTQMFSDILQEKLKGRMVSGFDTSDPATMSYEPEHSWNFELGGHFRCAEGIVRGDFALFWIECRDQQLTVFPQGASTGRMMTNAGRSRSRGGEASLQIVPRNDLVFDIAYGYTDARFVRHDDGREDFSGRRIPYAPAHTLSLGAEWTIPTGVSWLGEVVLRAGARGAGRIEWNEANTLRQPFYLLADASVRLRHDRYTLGFWGRNLGGKRYDVFYFSSMGNEFVQRGRPRTMGITLSINID